MYKNFFNRLIFILSLLLLSLNYIFLYYVNVFIFWYLEKHSDIAIQDYNSCSVSFYTLDL